MTRSRMVVALSLAAAGLIGALLLRSGANGSQDEAPAQLIYNLSDTSVRILEIDGETERLVVVLEPRELIEVQAVLTDECVEHELIARTTSGSEVGRQASPFCTGVFRIEDR